MSLPANHATMASQVGPGSPVGISSRSRTSPSGVATAITILVPPASRAPMRRDFFSDMGLLPG